jgi:hypothetical protein
MRAWRITVAGYELYLHYRKMLPGESETSIQFTRHGDSPVPEADNAWITAHVLFADITGTWWKVQRGRRG